MVGSNPPFPPTHHQARPRLASAHLRTYPPMNTATIFALDLAADGTYLVRATCEACQRTVMHGASRDASTVTVTALGFRSPHCPCRTDGDYELVDPEGVLPRRLAEITREVELRERRRTNARAFRLAANTSTAYLDDGFLRD